MIGAYYKLVALQDQIKAANKIKSKVRLDCISFTDMVTGGYKGLTHFVNNKGQLIFPCTDLMEFLKCGRNKTNDEIIRAAETELLRNKKG